MKNLGEEVDFKTLFLVEGLFSIRVTPLGPKLCVLEDSVGDDVV